MTVNKSEQIVKIQFTLPNYRLKENHQRRYFRANTQQQKIVFRRDDIIIAYLSSRASLSSHLDLIDNKKAMRCNAFLLLRNKLLEFNCLNDTEHEAKDNAKSSARKHFDLIFFTVLCGGHFIETMGVVSCDDSIQKNLVKSFFG